MRTKWEMPQILAAGAALKNTFCLTKDKYAFLSHHIGDLDNYETLVSFEEGIAHFEKLFRLQPEYIAYDLHPDYMSTRYAIQRAKEEGLPAYRHPAPPCPYCRLYGRESISLADTPVIGLGFDGTGYGTDGTIWGGEVLICDYRQFQRAAWLKPVPLPGGDAAIKEPWRIALSWLIAAGIELITDLPPLAFIDPCRTATSSRPRSKSRSMPLSPPAWAACLTLWLRSSVCSKRSATKPRQPLKWKSSQILMRLAFTHSNFDRQIIDPAQ